jgi:hypothetical protein
MAKNDENEDFKVEKVGFEPNFTTSDPTKKAYEAWIAKNITPKIKSGKKAKNEDENPRDKGK